MIMLRIARQNLRRCIGQHRVGSKRRHFYPSILSRSHRMACKSDQRLQLSLIRSAKGARYPASNFEGHGRFAATRIRSSHSCSSSGLGRCFLGSISSFPGSSTLLTMDISCHLCNPGRFAPCLSTSHRFPHLVPFRTSICRLCARQYPSTVADKGLVLESSAARVTACLLPCIGLPPCFAAEGSSNLGCHCRVIDKA